MKSKDAFIATWKCHIAGLALYGSTSDRREGPMAKAERALRIPADVEALLGRMYDYLAAEEVKPNGQPAREGVKK